jgi:hypothetical protein
VYNEAIDMSEVDVSLDNSRKLDKILRILEGDGPDVPGLVHRFNVVERAVFGKEERGGLVHQVKTLRQWSKWITHTLSGVGGALLTLAVEYAAKHI